ncbi:MAG: tetratricopeptide repeat protein [Planctomycetota bacterium]
MCAAPKPGDSELPDLEDDRIDKAMSIAFGSGSVKSAESAIDVLVRLYGTKLSTHLPGSSRERSRSSELRESDQVALCGPRYEILGEVGRGAMGVVLEARDVDLDRPAALKVMRASLANRVAMVERFLEEAQVQGQLRHPGIVPAYGLGLAEGLRPHFAMKLVQGKTLATLLGERDGPSHDLRRFLGILEQVCQTMGYAHARGVLHRDLKPSNVMVGTFGEVLVLDWGLAKVLRRPESPDRPDAEVLAVTTRRSDLAVEDSISGSVVGTPAYMPPEQANGRVEELDERSDVFALGAILCEILTGDPPYRRESGDPMLQARGARLEDALQRLQSSAGDAELLSLCRRCLSPGPEGRPRHAGIVAEEIAKHLEALEERAQQAKVAAAEQRALAEQERARVHFERQRAQWERKARWRSLALAASALAVLSVGAGGYLLKRHLDLESADRISARVTETLREAIHREGAGHWAEATASAKRAVALAETGGDDATIERAREVSSRLKRKEQEAEDRARMAAEEVALLARIEEIGIHHPGPHNRETMDAELGKAFRDFGIDVEVMEADEAAAVIRSRLDPVEIAAAVEEWAWFRQEWAPESAWRPVLDIVRAADPDPWRNRIRDAASRRDLRGLRSLAATADLESLPTRSLALLGSHLAKGDRQAAAEFLRAAHDRHPGDFLIVHELAHSYLYRQPSAHEEVLRFALAALAIRPDCACAWVEAADALHEIGDLEGGIAGMRRATEVCPGLAGAHHNLGNYLLEVDPDGAIEAYRRAIELKPDFAGAYNGLAVVYKQLGDAERAVPAAEKAVELGPHYPWAWVTLSDALLMRGDVDRASAAIDKALELDPGFAKAHVVKGLVLWRQRDIAGAIAANRRAISLDPMLPYAHTNLGVLLCDEVGDYQGAIVAFRSAVSLNPRNSRYHYNLGNALLDSGDVEGSIAACRQAIALQPDYAKARLSLGLGLRRKGLDEEAAAAFREAVRLDADWAEARDWLAWHLATWPDPTRRSPAEAVSHADKAVALEPERGEYWSTLGVARYRAGQPEAAIEALERSMSLGSGRVPHDWLFLALASWELRCEQEARAWFAKAEDWMSEHPEDNETLRKLHAEAKALLEPPDD